MAKGLREIKRQIKSTQNTKQITKALEMVSAAKLRRAQEGAELSRPFAEKMREVVLSIAAASKGTAHPMLQSRPVRNVGYVIITSDRGLAGGYNGNLLRQFMRTIKERHGGSYTNIVVYVIGRKGRDFLKRRGIPVVGEVTDLGDTPSFATIKNLAADAVHLFETGKCDELYLYYNHFINAASQTPTEKKLLPLVQDNLNESKTSTAYEYEPSAEVVLSSLLPKYAESLIYSALLNAKASEFGARMTAMSSATKNATKIIGQKTLEFNRARQAAITQEISEIVAGANA